MKKIQFFLVVMVMVTTVCAQARQMDRHLSMEIGGLGLGLSVNYEHSVFSQNTNIFVLRAGVGYMPLFVNEKFSVGTYSIIVGGKYINTYDRHSLVGGVSNSVAVSFAPGVSDGFDSVMYNYLFSPDLGYRYLISRRSGVFIGAGYSPVCSFNGLSITNRPIQYKNHFYLSIGYSI